jgi:uncharacterized membrane protein
LAVRATESLSQGESSAKETGRIEAFSDGVFAIAMTLLVLDLKVPKEVGVNLSLASALLEQWPSYLAFLISFATVGIMWMNHHRLFTLIHRTDHWLLVLNGLLLFGVTAVPFPTALLAAFLGSSERRTAALVYNGLFVVIAVLFNVLWRYASHKHRLLGSKVDRKAVEEVTRQYRYGPLLYGIAFALAFIHVGVSVTTNLALAVFFALPPRLTSRR